ncbi:prepilin-type N-terminal cleavage/methylation domain-containing protein [Fusobacterium animalis]|uniref:type II secretion system protein n=1 Tax=Fusobacterium animalis TaxID=76859 RepID=UPI001C6F3895|nr:prepilin-type N-terminal cleavage/methylation domain-containing protein [Fusobacterium animalis]QYR67480.1 prepilin-type N-terminal cleavage/methylation domain-containing protein [Fusobacterium animalis]
MNKNKAFSLMEVIVSVFILILVLIPSIKLNIQQIKTYSKIRNADSELHFFTSFNNYLKTENITTSHLEFNNYTDFITAFNSFGNSFQNLKGKNFKIVIDIEKTEVDFSNRKEKASLITVEYRGDKKIYKNTLLKFEE